MTEYKSDIYAKKKKKNPMVFFYNFVITYFGNGQTIVQR